jgi:hypothetical protein
MHATCDGIDMQSSFISDFGVTMAKIGQARLHIDATVLGMLKCEIEWNQETRQAGFLLECMGFPGRWCHDHKCNVENFLVHKDIQ